MSNEAGEDIPPYLQADLLALATRLRQQAQSLRRTSQALQQRNQQLHQDRPDHPRAAPFLATRHRARPRLLTTAELLLQTQALRQQTYQLRAQIQTLVTSLRQRRRLAPEEDPTG